MTQLALIRHGSTSWNAQKRLQGHADIPLTEDAKTQVGRWRLPRSLLMFDWYSSPLVRARETAALLGLATRVEPLLIEMNWGQWEGHRLSDLRDELGEEMDRNEARGLDFRPPGGESPRDVQRRIRPWLVRIGEKSIDSGAVTHRGVIRAVYSLATGWDMTAKAPDKFRDASTHLFDVDAAGNVAVKRMNVGLEAIA